MNTSDERLAEEDVKYDMQTLELRMQENQEDSQQAVEHQEESSQMLRQQLDELQKRLEEKDHKLSEAKEIIRVLRNEVQTLQQQLELQTRKYQDIIGQRDQTCQCVKRIDEAKTLTSQDPCMQPSSVTSDGYNNLHPSHADTDTKRSPQWSLKDQDVAAQSPQERPPLEDTCAIRTVGFVSPPNMFLSCTSEGDSSVSLGDSPVTSSQQVPLRAVTLKLKDCCEMLGPNGVYIIPEDDHNGNSGYDQHSDYDDDDDEDKGSVDGDDDECDSDYDPTNEGLNIQKPCETSNGEKTQSPRSLCESTGQSPKKTHECSECGEVFPFRSWLLRHQKTHSTDETRKRQTAKVKSHTHSTDKTRKRQTAKVKSHTHSTDKTRKRQTAKVKSHKCSECGKSFTSQSRLFVHQKVHDKTKPLSDTHVETQTTVEDGVYKVPTEDGNQDDDGRSGYNQRDDDVDESDDDGCGGGGDNDKDDGDYDPTSILAANSKTPRRRQYKSTGQRPKKTHECSECGKAFPFRSLLLYHQERRHTGENLHVCPHCEKTFALKRQLSLHLRRKHGQDMLYQCPICPENFMTASLLGKHKETHFKCVTCDKEFREQYQFTRHMRGHERKEKKIPQCQVCGKILSNLANLKIHLLVHSELRPHVCTQCGQAFKQLGNLMAHMKTHTQDRQFECSHCQKRFMSSSYLKVHLRIHTGEKPYSCALCDKKFSSSSVLRTHRITHSEERPYLCLQCGYTCKLKGAMTVHEARHAREKRQPCPYCNQSYEIYYLERHMRTHTGERPYKCSECGEAFSRPHYLQNHKLRHTGEKAHVCSVCGKAFARLDALKTHQRVHTGEKPFQCSVCEEKFSYIQTLQSHQKREHGVGPSHKCSQCGDGFKTAKELETHECVQGGKEKTLEEQADEAVNSLL